MMPELTGFELVWGLLRAFGNVPGGGEIIACVSTTVEGPAAPQAVTCETHVLDS